MQGRVSESERKQLLGYWHTAVRPMVLLTSRKPTQPSMPNNLAIVSNVVPFWGAPLGSLTQNWLNQNYSGDYR